ncbi:hypothetical protein Pth03_00010 [Planotetraspora thailandica]|uniref:Uncharacterized protein n=1 Tax=Planotetraspora thailandica TaxID=487172 RepID=A0A8J3UXE3_9ACTN|nr:hypothetical protein Pth03_00010 [Planotetraspora thailandica]
MLVGTLRLVFAQRPCRRDQVAGHQVGQIVGQGPEARAGLAVQFVRRDVSLKLGKLLPLEWLFGLAVPAAAAFTGLPAERPRPAAIATVPSVAEGARSTIT